MMFVATVTMYSAWIDSSQKHNLSLFLATLYKNLSLFLATLYKKFQLKFWKTLSKPYASYPIPIFH